MWVLGSELMSQHAYVPKCFYPLSHPSSPTLLGLSPRLPTYKTESFFFNQIEAQGFIPRREASQAEDKNINSTCGTVTEIFCDLG